MSPELLLVLAALGLVVLAVWLLVRRRRANQRRQEARRRANAPRDPFRQDHIGGNPLAIELGNTIQWLGSLNHYSVRGTLTLTDGAYTWWEHFIDPINGAKRYLGVSTDDGDVEVAVWTEVTTSFSIRPDRDQVTYDGVTYRRKEGGSATYTAKGTVNVPARGRVKYTDYVGPKGKLLSFEQFNDGPLELSLGEVIPENQLTIYPTAAI